MYFPYFEINSRLYFLSFKYGAIFAHNTIPECFTISDATYPILRTFVERSSRLNFNPLDKFCRTISPSKIVISCDISPSSNFCRNAFASVDLPLPDNPTKYTHTPFLGRYFFLNSVTTSLKENQSGISSPFFNIFRCCVPEIFNTFIPFGT